jgi:hypothetical protein
MRRHPLFVENGSAQGPIAAKLAHPTRRWASRRRSRHRMVGATASGHRPGARRGGNRSNLQVRGGSEHRQESTRTLGRQSTGPSGRLPRIKGNARSSSVRPAVSKAHQSMQSPGMQPPTTPAQNGGCDTIDIRRDAEFATLPTCLYGATKESGSVDNLPPRQGQHDESHPPRQHGSAQVTLTWQ